MNVSARQIMRERKRRRQRASETERAYVCLYEKGACKRMMEGRVCASAFMVGKNTIGKESL